MTDFMLYYIYKKRKGIPIMTININHVYSATVTVNFTSAEGITMRYNDNGKINDIIGRATENMIKHNFICAHITNNNDSKLLTIIERT